MFACVLPVCLLLPGLALRQFGGPNIGLPWRLMTAVEDLPNQNQGFSCCLTFCCHNVTCPDWLMMLSQRRLMTAVEDFINEGAAPAERMIRDSVACEHAYINTDHPSFVGGNRAIAQVLHLNPTAVVSSSCATHLGTTLFRSTAVALFSIASMRRV